MGNKEYQEVIEVSEDDINAVVDEMCEVLQAYSDALRMFNVDIDDISFDYEKSQVKVNLVESDVELH